MKNKTDEQIREQIRRYRETIERLEENKEEFDRIVKEEIDKYNNYTDC